MMSKIKTVVNDKKSYYGGMVLGLLYFIIYLTSIGDLFWGQRVEKFSSFFLRNGWDVMFKLRGPYIWEPIGIVKFPFGVIVNISPLNLALAGVITCLVTLNFMLFIYTITLPKSCRIKKNYSGFFGMILGFFTGFLCCVPTFLIPFASVVSGLIPFVVAIRAYIVPAIIILLSLGAISTIRRIG